MKYVSALPSGSTALPLDAKAHISMYVAFLMNFSVSRYCFNGIFQLYSEVATEMELEPQTNSLQWTPSVLTPA